MAAIATSVLKIFFLLIILLMLTSLIADYCFKSKIKEEIKVLSAQITSDQKSVSRADIKNLPDCVQRWLNMSLGNDKDKISSAKVKQVGEMKTSPDGKWMPFEALSFYSTDQPGFIWYARVKFAPLLALIARDKYHQGQGSMLIKLAAVFPVVNVSGGDEINQGSLQRFLGEMVWFPSAALSPFIQWEEIDQNSARATMSYMGVIGSGVFTFNESGEVVVFTANRPRAVGDHFEISPWSIPVREYKEFDGVRVPTKGEVIWKLADGDFNWYQFEVLDAEYNKPWNL